jgi:hypothetical protein
MKTFVLLTAIVAVLAGCSASGSKTLIARDVVDGAIYHLEQPRAGMFEIGDTIIVETTMKLWDDDGTPYSGDSYVVSERIMYYNTWDEHSREVYEKEYYTLIIRKDVCQVISYNDWKLKP